jgi:hypothetical protein
MGCPDAYRTNKEKPDGSQHVVRMDEMFVSEEEDAGANRTRTVFRTNDKRYWTLNGMTVWTVWDGGETDFDSRTVTMGKSIGYSGGGYGVVFCQGEYEVKGIKTPVMLVVMINNEGQYIIGKAVGGVFTDIGWWKASPYLRRGSGAANEVRVFYEAGNSEYCLEINGYVIENFRDDGVPALRGGKNGYIVVITPYDKFPESGIDVYFMEER